MGLETNFLRRSADKPASKASARRGAAASISRAEPSWSFDARRPRWPAFLGDPRGFRDHRFRDHRFRDHRFRDHRFRDHRFRDHRGPPPRHATDTEIRATAGASHRHEPPGTVPGDTIPDTHDSEHTQFRTIADLTIAALRRRVGRYSAGAVLLTGFFERATAAAVRAEPASKAWVRRLTTARSDLLVRNRWTRENGSTAKPERGPNSTVNTPVKERRQW